MRKILLNFVTALACFLSSCSKSEFPFLRQHPNENAIPGVYVLHKDSAERLKKEGYPDVSGKIELKENGTFEITQMPHYWLEVFYRTPFGEPKDGYDNCSGTWIIQTNSSVYDIVLYIRDFSSDSAFAKGKGYAQFLAGIQKQEAMVSRGGRVTNMGDPWTVGIIGTTKERKDYGLAVPLNHGDHGYLIFVRTNSIIPPNSR